MSLFLALLLIPLIEIGLFIEVGGAVGLWPTLALVLITAALGAALMRRQGLSALTRLQAATERGEDPRGPLAEGAAILLAGALMLTPGFFTDALGLMLLVPPARRALFRWIGPRLAARAAARGGGPTRTNDTISADYEIVEEPAPTGRSGWTRAPGPPEG